MTHPAQPDTAPAPQASPTSVTIPVPPAPAPQVQQISPDEIAARVRAEVQAEMSAQIEAERQAREAMEQRMAAFDTDLQTRTEQQRAAEQAAAQAAEEKRQAELSYAERAAEMEQRMTGQLTALQQQLAERDAVLERERQFNELMAYRSAQLQQHGDDIIPELRDLVQGNTPEEIDASISALKERSGSILQNVAQQAQAVRQNARGVGVTAPPVGPMDNNSGHQTFSADDIRNMDMTQYAQHRARLLGAASQTSQRDRGMFG